MTDIARIIAFLKREYPLPQVDPAWVRDCVQALIDDGQGPTIDAVHEQYLFSDLSHSTLPSPAIPSDAHNTTLFTQPTLLHIISITEIGSSAFQLQTTLEQRRDVLDGATRIRRMGEEETDEEVEEGKLPAYPRGMLKMEVSDGRRVMKAMEYRRIGELKLGETALGAKVQDVRALRGTLLLSPENARVLGYQVAHLESEQAKQFVAGLLKRLGKAPPMEHREDDVPMERPQPTIPRGAAPAQTLGARRRLTQIPRQLPAPPSIQAPPVEVSPPPIIRLTPRLIPKAESSRIAGRKPASPESLTLSQTRPARAARNQASFRLDALYQQPFPLHDDDDDKAFANPRQQHQNHDTNRGRTATTAQYHSSEPDYDFDVDDSVIRQVDEVEQRASGQRAAYEIDEEDDEFDVDDSFMRHVEDIEARAGKRPRVMAEDRAEVIEISD